MQLNADQRQVITICRQLTIVLKHSRRMSSRRCARSPKGERAHRLERTSRLQQEACMQLRCRPKATNIMPSTNNSLEIIQASEL